MSEISWMMATLDLPRAGYESAVGFWTGVTRSRLGWSFGGSDEFTALLPEAGSPHLLVQRVDAGDGGIHVDLHVPDRSLLVARARDLGASVRSEGDWTVMTSPGGLPFCVVQTSRAEGPRSPRFAGVVDQVCIDVPHQGFEAEVEFWSELLGVAAVRGSRPEFAVLPRPDHLPLRLLLQRLDQPATGAARAHLDLAAGDQVAAVIAEHEAVGAALARHGHGWVTMRDPIDRFYCITSRDPETGTL